MSHTVLTCLFALWPSVAQHAQHAGVPPRLALAVIMVESGCRNVDHDSSGARGFMQVMPFWANTGFADHCGSRDLRHPHTNLCFGTHILRHYERQCAGDWPCALRRYSGHSLYYKQRVRCWMQVLDDVHNGRGVRHRSCSLAGTSP